MQVKTIIKSTVEDIRDSSYERYREYLSRFNPSHKYNRLQKEEFLQKLRILSDRSLTIGGALALGTDNIIQKKVPDFRVDYLEIPGTDYSNAPDRYTYRIDEEENLWEYFFSIFDRLLRFLDLPFTLSQEGFASEDYPQLDALREALVNMLMHSDYFSAACPRVRVFDDRIEFFNPGALPKPLEKIMEEDISMPRNPVLAKFFRVVRLAENAGYGFDKMISGWTAYTGKPPEFDEGRDYLKATFFLKSATQKTTQKEQGTRKTIIDLLENEPYLTRKELAEKIGDITEDGVKYHLEKLKGEGRIKRVGGRKARVTLSGFRLRISRERDESIF